MVLSKQAILKTLLYSDLFSFPLTQEEIWRYLITEKKIDRVTFATSLVELCRDDVRTAHGYYALAGRESLIQLRKTHLGELQKKLSIAKQSAYYLSYIPTISFIGISGGVAVGNVDTASDIDLFIITKKRTVFMTRLWALMLLEVLRLRRKKHDPNPANKICVNLLVDETQLAWSTKKHDLFTAHEIAQIKPLFQRNNMYATFLEKNQWIAQYLPHAGHQQKTLPGDRWHRRYVMLFLMSKLLTLLPFEYIVRSVQQRIMQKSRTREVVTAHMLAFHPVDYRVRTLRMWRAASHKFGLLTNK